MFLPTPIPPATCRAPELVDVELTALDSFARSTFIVVGPRLLENVTLDPVEETITLPRYNDSSVFKYNFENGCPSEPRSRPPTVGNIEPETFV